MPPPPMPHRQQRPRSLPVCHNPPKSPPIERFILPQHVWATLNAPLQARIRRDLLQITLEVIHHAAEH
jgi:hypothetical protein